MERTFLLRRGDTLALPRGRGTTLALRGGDVWITQLGDPKDYVLRDCNHTLTSEGCALIYALRDARVVLRGAAHAYLRVRGEAPRDLPAPPALQPFVMLRRLFAWV